MEFLETGLVLLEPCGHVIHSTCHDQLVARGHVYCPLCRGGQLQCEGSDGSSSVPPLRAQRIRALSRRVSEDELDHDFRLEALSRMHSQGLIECLESKEKVWSFACFICGLQYDVTNQNNGPILKDQNFNPARAFADAHDVVCGTEGLLLHFPAVAICCGSWLLRPYKVEAQSFVQMRLVQEGAAPDTLFFRGRRYREMREAYVHFLQCI